MKNILVLTDFSKSADEAAGFGVMLSSRLNTNLLLFNTYVTNSATAFVGKPWEAENIIWGDDDSKDNLNKLAARLKLSVAGLPEDAHRPSIYCDNGEGKLGIVVPNIVRRQNIELIVMGARTENPEDDLLFGSDLNSVIQKASRPILVVPSQVDPVEFKKVIFATDFDKSDLKAIHYLNHLGKLLNFQLEVVHIVHPDRSGATKREKETALEEKVVGLNYPQITFHEVNGGDFAENIMHIYEKTGAGLLAMVHHQHSFIMRMFHQSATKNVLDNQQVPLMIFPSKMD